MEILTAVGNEKIYEELRKNNKLNYKDIQYQEAVIEILEKNKKIRLLILSSLIPGELKIEEFINIIKYINPELEIIIILENQNNKLKRFLISKGINNIYYNNKSTYDEIIEKINNKKNELNNNNKEIKIIKNKIILNIIKIIKLIIKKIINNELINNKKNNRKKINNKNTKIISVIGAPKIGKSIFTLLLCLKLKNKKILIVDLNAEENNLKIIIGKKINIKENIEKNIIKYKNNIDILLINNIKNNYHKIISEEMLGKYQYIFLEIRDIYKEKEIIKKTDESILLIEANLIGIKESKDILEELINIQKIQKNKIRVIFNKYNNMAICMNILRIMFSDFNILGILKYSPYYNLLINTNGKIINNKINKEIKKIIEKL